MPAWRRSVVTAGANCAGFILLMLGFRMRVRGRENLAKAKELGAVSHSFSHPLLTGVSLAHNAGHGRPVTLMTGGFPSGRSPS